MATLPPPESALLAPGDWRMVFDAPADPAPRLLRVQSVTDREHEVLRWVAAGKTDRDIGAILGISHRTVHKHLQSAYAKLGVETRTAAVMRLVAAHYRPQRHRATGHERSAP
jgi:DNA-binding CsgD family transcriptional regulator